MLAQDITHLREALGWSMSRLATELNVPPALVVDWEEGARFPTAKHSNRLAELLAATQAERSL